MARAPFGVWLDVDVPVPALLLVTEFAESGSRGYQFEEYPQLDEVVNCRVTNLTHDGRIGCSQRS